MEWTDNAYVSGVKEDLHLEGNQLVRLQTLFTLGSVLGQIPFAYLLTRLPTKYTIPAMDVLWGVFTLLQFRVTSFSELAAYRFMVGWFEAGLFVAVHYVFGSWYRGDEIARRGGVFYVGLPLGTLTASFIQAGASSGLDGVAGMAGWRWMYIICAIITIPIGLIGFVVLPGTPDKPNRLILRQSDIDLGNKRLERAGHGIFGHFEWQSVVKLARNWKLWAFLALDVFFWNGANNTNAGGYLLWLKSLKRYSTSRLNELSAISPGLGIFYTLLICFSSDLLLGPEYAITVSHTWNIIGLVILVVWDVPEPALWFAFATTYSANAMSSVLYGWLNSELSYSPVERALALVTLNTVSQSTTAWTPLLVFKTVEGPRFTKGYSFTLANAICLIAMAHTIRYGIRREERRKNNERSADDVEWASAVHPDVVDIGSGLVSRVSYTVKKA